MKKNCNFAKFLIINSSKRKIIYLVGILPAYTSMLNVNKKYESKNRKHWKIACFLRIRTQTTPIFLKLYSFAQLAWCTQYTEYLLCNV